MSQTAVPKLLVGKNAANTYSAPTNAFTNLTGIALQDIYLVDADGGATHGNILDATTMASVTKFSVVGTSLNQDGTIKTYIGDPITKSMIQKATRDAYTAPVQQVTYLGYDGVSATKDLSVVDEKNYRLHITLKTDNMISEYKEQFGPIFGAYADFASTNPTFAEKLDFIWQFIKVANGSSGQSNFFASSGRPTSLSSYIRTELVSSAVGTAFTNAVTIANGSSTLTSTAHGRSVGDYIRIGAASAATTTNGIYRVSQIIDANTLVIETPYQGATLSAVAGGAAHTLITGTLVGIRLTAKNQGFQRYSNKNFVRFTASFFLDDANRDAVNVGFTAPVTTTEGVYGSGTPDQVLEKEMSYLGYVGMFNYYNEPPIEPNTYSSTTATYDFYSIEYILTSQNDFYQGKKLRVLELALVAGSAQNTALQAVIAALPTYSSIS